MSHVERHATLHGEPDVMAKRPTNMAASVRHRLADIARSNGEDFQYVLTRYGIERLLYRLAQSSHAGQCTFSNPNGGRSISGLESVTIHMLRSLSAEFVTS